MPGAKTLVMGTNYSDLFGRHDQRGVERIAVWRCIEPLALLFCDEVRKRSPEMLGLDGEHPAAQAASR